MRRGESMFDVDPSVHDEIEEGIKTEGSNLCGISTNCTWIETNNIGMYQLYYIIKFYFNVIYVL